MLTIIPVLEFSQQTLCLLSYITSCRCRPISQGVFPSKALPFTGCTIFGKLRIGDPVSGIFHFLKVRLKNISKRHILPINSIKRRCIFNFKHIQTKYKQNRAVLLRCQVGVLVFSSPRCLVRNTPLLSTSFAVFSKV